MRERRLPLPQPVPIIRENHEVVVEFQQGDRRVGEINFTAIFEDWMERLGLRRQNPEVP